MNPAESALLAYRLRTVRVGVQTTVLVVTALALYALLPGRPTNDAAFAAVVVAGAVGGLVTYLLPWTRLFNAGWGMRFLYAWSVVDIALISAGVWITGGARSELFVLYALTTIFFAASYPRKGQAMLLGFTAAAFLAALVLAGTTLTPASALLRLASLGITAFMASFMSRQLLVEMGAHVEARSESEGRATLLALVADAARGMSSLDPDRVLETVVASSVDMGFDASEICVLDEAAGTWMQAYHRGIVLENYQWVQPIGSGLVGRVRELKQTTIVDYDSFDNAVASVQDYGFGTTIASPVFAAGELTAVLISGRRDHRPLFSHEIECHDLLAAQAGSALMIARRYTERQAFEARLRHQATHDPLTGLPNRSLLFDRLEHARASASRDDDPLALLFCDLDRFKTVNDSLGHDAGDELLVAVARRLETALRPSDTLARYGGDEFTIVLESTDQETAVKVALRILASLSDPFSVSGRTIRMSASIGISLAAPDGSGDPLREADLAMYRAKQRGGGRWELFTSEMNVEAGQQLEREAELRQAVEHEEFTLLYQPMLSLISGRIEGVEALVRWRHPRRGLVSPAEFIPLAEATGLIVPLGRWVVEEACRQAQAWRDQGLDLRMSVNLSAVQFTDPTIVDDVSRALAESGLDPSCLVLEITESVLMDDVDANLLVMAEIEALGVSLALDDFGQGYSSLSYLKRLPLRTVKIDKSFVDGLADSREDQAIVRSVVGLARELGMSVTAEGVETTDQLDHVRRLGCDAGQGYLFSRPVSGDAIPHLAGRSARLTADLVYVAS